MKTNKLFVISAALLFLCTAFLFSSGSASVAVDFPADKAGISAYVNVGKNVDLDTVKALMNIVDSTETYAIAIVDVSGNIDPHVYISEDGWVVAYYTRSEPPGAIMDWDSYYAGSSVIGTTTLENAISVACGVVGVSYSTLKPDIRFYDFRYPNATGMTVIVETRNEEGTDSFKLTIPNSVKLYEASYSQYAEYTTYKPCVTAYHDFDFYFKIDGKEVDRIHIVNVGYCPESGTRLSNGFYDLADFTKLVTHTIGVTIYEQYDDATASSSVATVLIYQEY